MSSRVGPHGAVRAGQPPGADGGDLSLGRRDVVDHHVVMDLLRPRRVAPHRRRWSGASWNAIPEWSSCGATTTKSSDAYVMGWPRTADQNRARPIGSGVS